jgi:hypothetical protein
MRDLHNTCNYALHPNAEDGNTGLAVESPRQTPQEIGYCVDKDDAISIECIFRQRNGAQTQYLGRRATSHLDKA